MRRLGLMMALLGSGVVVFLAPTPVSAGTAVVEPEPVARMFAAPTSPQTIGPAVLAPPYNQVPWGLDRIDQRTTAGNQSYSFSNAGAGVDVYVVDTGIDADHPEFDARVKDGWSYRSNATTLAAYKSSRAANISNPNTGIPACAPNSNTNTYTPSSFDAPASVDAADKGWEDNNGHGTHVAGSVGGNYTGVAKAVDLIPVRVLDSCGNGNLSMIYYGLSWIKDHHVSSKPAVVNLSLGFPGVETNIETMIAALIAEGIVVVVAAGNIESNDSLGDSCDTTPAGTTGTISVASSNQTDKESSFSYYGRCVDIFAPGELIVSTWPKYQSDINTYYLDTGTSMAAPHVAGAVARFLQTATINSGTSAAAWNWLKLNATCNAISYYSPTAGQPSRTDRAKTPNRLLAVDAPATTPCAPAAATVNLGDTTATVQWEPVASDNGSETLDYTATLSPGNQTCTRTPVQTLSCSFTGLASGTTYTATVRARNAQGLGTAVTALTGVPQAVTSLKGTVNANSLDLSWVQGVGDEGTTYTATASPGGAACTSTTTGCSISGLTLGTEYTISVVGVNARGSGVAATVKVLFVRAPLAVTKLAADVLDNALSISWEQAVGDTTGITYTATASPGGLTCTSTSTSCVINSLVNGTEYSISVVGVNSTGTGTAATVKGTPDGIPDVPLVVQSVVSKNKITLSWPAVTTSVNVTYLVTSRPGNLTCTTVLTSCEVAGLTYGVDYTFVISTQTPTGFTSSATLLGSARPGFKVKKIAVKRSSSTVLTSFMSSISTGKKTWSETGSCSIKGTKLVAPKKATKCVLILKVAKKGSFPAMSTRLAITVK